MPSNNLTEEDLSRMSPEEIAELQKQSCIFCKIANKEIPAKIIHEDADTICILDINPASEGHILVYPKKHYMIMPHVPDEILEKVFKNVKLMSHTLLKSLQCKGTTIFIANGAAAGQKAPHVLVHVFPRRENDGLVHLPNYELSEEQLEKLKLDLERYISQIFGRKKPIIKTAEFTEKPKEPLVKKPVEKEPAKEDDNEDNSETEDDDKEQTPVKKTTSKKKDDSDKKEDNKDSKKNDNKVDLDDIAKLFG